MPSDGPPIVLAAKLSVPRAGPQTITRDRLLRLLDEASGCPLTVVSAPAGYGKTTAVSQRLQTVSCARAWVSLDVLDNDPQRLCAHLVAAVDRAWPAAMVDAERALLGGSDLLNTFVPLAAQALAERTTGIDDGPGLVLVLEDYQLVKHPVCHRVISALIDALPDGVRIVIISRTSPPLRLVRRRELGQCAELAATQLLFTNAESERLLNQSLRLGLEREQLATVQRRVEGWAAGLTLVAAVLTSDVDKPQTDAVLRAFGRSRIDEFLVEEVFDQQRPEMQEFLCVTSILERLDPDSCEALLDDRAARELLDEACSSDLFITEVDPGDGHSDRRRIRYHRMFTEMLGGSSHGARRSGSVSFICARRSGLNRAHGSTTRSTTRPPPATVRPRRDSCVTVGQH